VLTLDALEVEDIEQVLMSALTDPERGLGLSAENVEDGVLTKIAELAAGDARFALNTLEVCASLVGAAVGATPASPADEDVVAKPRFAHDESSEQTERSMASPLPETITTAVLKRALAGRSLLYDKSGDEHFNAISALHKSLRGSDPDAALYWMARMLEGGEDPKYVVRRLIRFASEDVGLADPWALHHAIAAKEAVEFLGMPECNTALTQLAVYLACAPKSNAMYLAYGSARKLVEQHGALPAPLHIRNAPTRLMDELGYGKDYKYAHDYEGGFVADNYWPEKLAQKAPRLVHLTGRGAEKTLMERLRQWWGSRFEEDV
jgi:putative ATPase